MFNILRYTEKDAVNSFLYSIVDSAKAVDKYTVVMTLKEPNAWTFNQLFGKADFIMAPEVVKESADAISDKVIGTGPYILSKFRLRVGTTGVRNHDYGIRISKATDFRTRM